jgi:ABC-type glycerol-3-phosphate transport system substrate-binding protein
LQTARLVGLGLVGPLVAACGTSSTPSPSAPSGGQAPAAAPTTSSAAAPASSGSAPPVTLSVISWNSGSSADAFKNAMDGINNNFKKTKPNVTVNFEMLGQGTTWTQAQTSRIASQTVDVTAMYGFAPQDIINFQPDTQ